MKSYAVMHLDRHVATIRSDGCCTIYHKSFMPYNLYLERAAETDMQTRMNNLNNFYYWAATRLLTLDRKYAKEILNSLGMKQAVTDKDRAEIAISYHALCLTDVYWVRELRESVRYEEINLYDHSLSDAFVDVSLRGHALTAQNAELISEGDSAGDLSTLGLAPKAWIRREGKFWLLKDGDLAEVEAELAASQIIRCFDVDQVLYEPWEYQGQVVSRSPLLTSIESSIVPMEYVEVYAVNHGKDARELALTRDPLGYHRMNIVDYLTGNTDRHWGNWGFCVDNKTNKLGKLHSLMDFNRCFRSYDSLEGARCLTSAQNMSQKDAAIMGVQAVGLGLIRPLPENPESIFGKINQIFHMRLDLMFQRRLEILCRAEK